MVKNAHGDIIALQDQNGNNVATYSYDTWGNVLISSDTNNINPYRYAGYRYDSVTGLYYLIARYYDPVVGRFLSTDPEKITPSYSYVDYNPVSYFDPDGRTFLPLLVDLYKHVDAPTESVGEPSVYYASSEDSPDHIPNSSSGSSGNGSGSKGPNKKKNDPQIIKRGKHAEIRANQGRNVSNVINDVQKARRADVFFQEESERWIIRGSKGRFHVLEQNGEVVTTMNRVTNLSKRLAEGKWRKLNLKDEEIFYNSFKDYLSPRNWL